MIPTVSESLQKFQNEVGIKFQLYNSLFLSLPFYGIDKTGVLLSLFSQDCEEGFARGNSPTQIIERFFENPHRAFATEEEKISLLFRFVQYAERQVVLFDALEDAAFDKLNDPNGTGSLKHLESSVLQNNKTGDFLKKLQNFSVRLVLTAHPTQFYPDAVLGIINDLVEAIEQNDVSRINTYLQQLGRTPFFKKQKPTPFDEAQSLIWYLENVFYTAIGNILTDLKNTFPDGTDLQNLVRMGFWSGGDRDGNPFVTKDTTLRTAEALRLSVLKCYYKDVQRLRRRLTFSGVETVLSELAEKLYENAFQANENALTKVEILDYLNNIREILLNKHNGLFVHLVNELIFKVETFGLHFASLDIRQDSGVHQNIMEEIAEKSEILPKNYVSLSDAEKIEKLLQIDSTIDSEIFDEDLAKDTLRNIASIKEIQTNNGAKGCERYIISHAESALNVIEVFALFLLGGWQKEELNIDIVPLFETVDDLKNASRIMRELYENETYREHLSRRNDTQTIMLGFSDGTKDGGYLMANWSIYKAKDELTRISREFGIEVIFFDGRGGPPARGGGKTHRFYASMGENISDKSIELTVQGQTVSSNFGTINAAQFNIEQLLHAGIYHEIISQKAETFSREEEKLMQNLAEESFAAYSELKNDPLFLEYLADVSPLKFYAQTNIGSRPAKRGGTSQKLTLDSLRAIPFVGAWSQLKQNVPGFYGVGSAMQKMEKNLDEIKAMYKNNAFFKALMDNCEMAMEKTFFPLTQFLSEHPVYGKIWQKIRDEYELSRKYLAIISDTPDLMANFPVEQQSVQTREKIVLPLTTIQQFALTRIREIEDEEQKKVLEKLIIRCSFGIINAGRNSA